MADYRRHYDDSPRSHDRDCSDRANDEVRSGFGNEDARRRRGNDEREDPRPYGGERTARYDPAWRAQGEGYREDRASRWENPRDERDYYGPDAATGAYRTDDRDFHDRYRYRDEPSYRDDASRYGSGWSGRFRYPHGADAADDYYRAARQQREDYLRWEAQSPGAEWEERPNGAPLWTRRERGGYWRHYDGPRYSGRGPKNYQRSDDRVREEICDTMTDDPLLDASDITVQVEHGEVTLSGTVASREQKRRAEDVAERISGVKDVTNQLRVSREANGHSQTASPPVTQASGQGTPSKSASGTSA